MVGKPGLTGTYKKGETMPVSRKYVKGNCVRCGYPTQNSRHDDCCPDGEDHKFEWLDEATSQPMFVEEPKPSPFAQKIATTARPHDNDNPLWQGPCAPGPLGGVTQSMLARFFSCRERFRLKYVCGLEPHEKWNHRLGYGEMWHVCEENHAAGFGHEHALCLHADRAIAKHPFQRDEIAKWYNVCRVQFPEYIKYWSEHPDVLNRTPLMQEQVFDAPYTLPSGRVVRLRGKWDSVDLIDGGIYLQENKTKGDIDKQQVERQLKFDLQTMLYLIALKEEWGNSNSSHFNTLMSTGGLICGVRYNVVRRPLSGGKGSITPHKEKRPKKGKYVAAETPEQFYERLRRDYIAAEPDYWFFRVRAEISERDIQVFRDTCLDPLLETVIDWYEAVTKTYDETNDYDTHRYLNYRTPFGIYNALEEAGSTEYDAYLNTGSEAGLRRVETLFPELQS